MKYDINYDGLTVSPESMADVIDIEDIVRKWRGEPEIPDDVRAWIIDYWDYVRFNEHGNQASYCELVEMNAVRDIVRQLTGHVSLSECDIWGYLTYGLDNFEGIPYDDPVFSLCGRMLVLNHKYYKPLKA